MRLLPRARTAILLATLALAAACSSSTSEDSSTEPTDAAPGLTRCPTTDAQTTDVVANADASPAWIEVSITMTLDTSSLVKPDLSAPDGLKRWEATLAPLLDDVIRELIALPVRNILRLPISEAVVADVRADAVRHLPCLPHVKALSPGGGFTCSDICPRDACAEGNHVGDTCPAGCTPVVGTTVDAARGCATHVTLACALSTASIDTTHGPLSCYVDETSGTWGAVNNSILSALGLSTIRPCTREEGGGSDPSTVRVCAP
jgi:hypothetical protein